VHERLREKIETIDWEIAKRDVRPFLRDRQLRTLDLWNKGFFLEFVDPLQSRNQHNVQRETFNQFSKYWNI
jgi:hypothetical protein